MQYDGKIILLVCDGMADMPVKELDGKTPLEYAETPNMDELASKGITGLMDPIAPGIPPSSDTSHLAIFGYDPEKEYPGRGLFEAAGYGYRVSDDEVAFRCNFSTVRKQEDELIVIDRRAGRISGNDAETLAKEIQKISDIDGVKIKFIHTLEHRGFLILKGKDLSANITDCDPHEINAPVLKSVPLESAEDFKAAQKTAKILNEFVLKSFSILNSHPVNVERIKRGKLPANIVLPRGAGKRINLESFEERWGMKPACIAAGPLYRGVALELGFKLIEVEGATGLPNTNIRGKFEAAVNALNNYDFVFIHIKGTDNLSHSKDAKGKAEMISRIDKNLPIIMDVIKEGVTFVLTADHTTPCSRGIHSGDPVPLLIVGPHVRKDHVKHFDEINVAKGGLHRIRGKNLMYLLLDVTHRAPEYGLRPSSKHIRYIPKTWNALKL